ncbi:hypothetical protein CUMW_274660 [Citrus unshiu]|uniref:Uncharacterized protein n=1 Tax=Citrus unshiu TaxID=55188 RepID=A0A2H5MYL8_CITUN|nr:hypothetical protein CUMW_274660 [Citrus unshiu]
MVICGARKGQPVYDAVKKTLLDRVLNPNSNAMSKIITENASEEFLYSLSNYCGLQKEEEDSCGDDDDVDGEDEIDMIDDEVTKNL